MIRELKTFVMVCRHGTFAAAGQQIGLTQSAVSAQIRQLEDALGMPLFDRSGRSGVLNSAGKRVLPMAEEILDLFGRMSIPSSLEDYRGELRIGAINTAQTGILPDTLLRLRQQAPAIEPKLVPGVSLSLFGKVDAGEIDLAIIIRPPFALPKELHAEVISREPFMLLVPNGIRVTSVPELLRQQPFIRYDRHSFGGRQVTRFLRQHRITVQQVLELDELDAIVKMVECGLGVALVPQAGLWLERQAEMQVIPLGELTFHRELVLITRYANRDLPLQRLFRSCLLAAHAARAEPPVGL